MSFGGGGGVNLPWVYVHSALYENLFGVMVFQRSMVNWRREGIGSVCTGVVVFHRSTVNWRRGGVILPWVYVYSAIYILEVISLRYIYTYSYHIRDATDLKLN